MYCINNIKKRLFLILKNKNLKIKDSKKKSRGNIKKKNYGSLNEIKNQNKI